MSEREIEARIVDLRSRWWGIFEISDELGVTAYTVVDVVARMPSDPMIEAWTGAARQRYGDG